MLASLALLDYVLANSSLLICQVIPALPRDDLPSEVWLGDHLKWL